MSWAECGGVWEEGLKSKEGGALACAWLSKGGGAAGELRS